MKMDPRTRRPKRIAPVFRFILRPDAIENVLEYVPMTEVGGVAAVTDESN
jgi:hypothetical protein